MGISTHPGGIFYIVAVNVLQKGPSVFAFYKKLPHMGNIKHPGGFAHGFMLGQDAFKLHRQQPTVKVHHFSAGGFASGAERNSL